MSIVVKGIEIPKEPDEMIELAIFGDGKTLKTGESWRSPVDGKCYYWTSEDMNTSSAFAVHPHGRLIDADALCDGLVSNHPVVIHAKSAPTIIPAEEGET